ncbi:hypothetical protein LCGC14_0272550 [marine sediment metagenome]|uniref:Uncharacterized protein n=1 Tax=marine sediment metagenome TaxID=412755 RepID=A0A0F9TYF4_9ZZZZ
MNATVRARLQSTWMMIGLIFIASAVLLGSALGLSALLGIPVGDMTRDPTAVAGVSIYVGFLSQFGIFLWVGAAAVCLFGAAVLPASAEQRENKRFLLVSGALSLVLGFDDIFLLHEAFFPHIGISEMTVLAAYGLFVLYYLARFYKTLWRTEFILLAMAFGFFGLSVIFDLLEPGGIDPYLAEDGVKLIGLLSWTSYYFRTTLVAVRMNALQSETELAGPGYSFGLTRSSRLEALRRGAHRTAPR